MVQVPRCILLSLFLGSREISNEEYCNNRILKLRPQFMLMQAYKTPVEIQQGTTFLRYVDRAS